MNEWVLWETKMADVYLNISCSFSSSSRCLRSTDSMIWRSSAVRWLRSGIGGSDGRRPIDAMSAERTSADECPASVQSVRDATAALRSTLGVGRGTGI